MTTRSATVLRAYDVAASASSFGHASVGGHGYSPGARSLRRPEAGTVGLLRYAAPTLVVARSLFAGAFIVLVLAITVPTLCGWRPLVVMSGSMEPAIRTGDVVVAQSIRPLEARIGDVVTFRELRGTRLITHRVRSVTTSRGEVRFVTKGDANTSVQRWSISQSGRIGLVRYRLPRVGFALYWLHTPALRILVLLTSVLAGASILRQLWRRPPARGARGAPAVGDAGAAPVAPSPAEDSAGAAGETASTATAGFRVEEPAAAVAADLRAARAAHAPPARATVVAGAGALIVLAAAAAPYLRQRRSSHPRRR